MTRLQTGKKALKSHMSYSGEDKKPFHPTDLSFGSVTKDYNNTERSKNARTNGLKNTIQLSENIDLSRDFEERSRKNFKFLEPKSAKLNLEVL